MRKVDDLTNRKFGSLTVTRFIEIKHSQARWECICDCGNTSQVFRSHLINGTTKSCGCSKNNHFMKDSRIYRIWVQMKARCNNPNHKGFMDYGGRGIKVCEEWHDFRKFLKDMESSYDVHAKKFGEYDTTLDRINNEKGYSKDNCRWATRKLQRRNCRTSKFYEYRGSQITAGEIEEVYGIKYATFESRLRRGWAIDKIIETPVAKQVGGVKSKKVKVTV